MEHQSAYTTPVYPQIATITNNPAPCESCGGPMEPDIVLGDLHQCAACGCRRMVPTQAAAANSHDDAIRALFDELLEECRAYVATRLHGRVDVWERDEVMYRNRLDALLGKAD